MRYDDEVKIRIVTDNPPIYADVEPVKPTLEDLYLYIFEEDKK